MNAPTMVWTIHDLYAAPPDAFQLCRVCGSRYSANRRDYFGPPETELRCCGEPVSVVTAADALQTRGEGVESPYIMKTRRLRVSDSPPNSLEHSAISRDQGGKA